MAHCITVADNRFVRYFILILDTVVLPKPFLYGIFVLNGISFSFTAASL